MVLLYVYDMPPVQLKDFIKIFVLYFVLFSLQMVLTEHTYIINITCTNSYLFS